MPLAGIPEERVPMHAKVATYGGNGATADGDADAQEVIAQAQAAPRIVRKPDPPLREIRRQISFGSGSGFGSIKKKAISEAQGMMGVSTESAGAAAAAAAAVPPPVAEEPSSFRDASPTDEDEDEVR